MESHLDCRYIYRFCVFACLLTSGFFSSVAVGRLDHRKLVEGGLEVSERADDGFGQGDLVLTVPDGGSGRFYVRWMGEGTLPCAVSVAHGGLVLVMEGASKLKLTHCDVDLGPTPIGFEVRRTRAAADDRADMITLATAAGKVNVQVVLPQAGSGPPAVAGKNRYLAALERMGRPTLIGEGGAPARKGNPPRPSPPPTIPKGGTESTTNKGVKSMPSPNHGSINTAPKSPEKPAIALKPHSLPLEKESPDSLRKPSALPKTKAGVPKLAMRHWHNCDSARVLLTRFVDSLGHQPVYEADGPIPWLHPKGNYVATMHLKAFAKQQRGEFTKLDSLVHIALDPVGRVGNTSKVLFLPHWIWFSGNAIQMNLPDKELEESWFRKTFSIQVHLRLTPTDSSGFACPCSTVELPIVLRGGWMRYWNYWPIIYWGGLGAVLLLLVWLYFFTRKSIRSFAYLRRPLDRREMNARRSEFHSEKPYLGKDGTAQVRPMQMKCELIYLNMTRKERDLFPVYLQDRAIDFLNATNEALPRYRPRPIPPKERSGLEGILWRLILWKPNASDNVANNVASENGHSNGSANGHSYEDGVSNGSQGHAEVSSKNGDAADHGDHQSASTVVAHQVATHNGSTSGTQEGVSAPSASKSRSRWDELAAWVRDQLERLRAPLKLWWAKRKHYRLQKKQANAPMKTTRLTVVSQIPVPLRKGMWRFIVWLYGPFGRKIRPVWKAKYFSLKVVIRNKSALLERFEFRDLDGLLLVASTIEPIDPKVGLQASNVLTDFVVAGREFGYRIYFDPTEILHFREPTPKREDDPTFYNLWKQGKDKGRTIDVPIEFEVHQEPFEGCTAMIHRFYLLLKVKTKPGVNYVQTVVQPMESSRPASRLKRKFDAANSQGKTNGNGNQSASTTSVEALQDLTLNTDEILPD